ncbi:MAG: T9SS type A sorting domain-containing protein [Bacteroidetes bacterium]|nr:T9SS type A sorting domain-containing protein [Bacteroidota bacterium]
MNSKNIHFLSALMLLISHISFAHFGQRGPLGGTATIGYTYDTLVCIGTAEGGIFFSTNSNTTAWSVKPVGLHSGKITAITHSGKYLFTGTAETGVYRYTGFVGSDRYWEKVSSGLTNTKIKSLAAIDSITVVVGTDGGGLFKTKNKGASWTAINNVSLNSKVITAIVNAGARLLLSTQDGGVFFSDDKGDTWQSFNDVNTAGIAGTNMLSYNATSDELLVLNNSGLFIAGSASTVNTANYSAVTALANTIIKDIDNNGTTWIIATDKGVYTSASGSISFSAQNNGLPSTNVNVVVAFKLKSRFIAGVDHETMYKSNDTGISWSAVNTGFNNLATYAMFTNGVNFVVAATERGVHISTDFGANYKILNKGLSDSLNVSDITLFGTKLLATTKTGVFLSADTAKNWSDISGAIGSVPIKKVFSSASYAYVITADGKVYQSDLVNGWTLIQTGLPLNVKTSSLAFYEGKIILGAYGDGVYTADEAFSSWTALNTGLTNKNVTSVTTLVRAAGTKLFAGTDGAGVFVADVVSSNWTATSPTSISHTTMINLDGSKIEAMATYGGYVFASYQGGLLTTKDFGQTWVAGGNQFNLPSYTHVSKISCVTTRVYVVTDNNGLYSNALSELDPVASISEAQNLLCNNTCNGTAAATVVAGSGAVSYLWSNGQTSATATGLCAGKYVVTVTVGVETATDSIVISEPAALSVVLSSVASSGSNGEASALVSGGKAPYSYAWSNGKDSSAIVNLAPGKYDLTISDANGCTLDTSVNIVSSNGVMALENNVVNVFPNPSNGKVILDLSSLKGSVQSIAVYDVTGRMIQNHASVHVSSFALDINGIAGVYFIRVSTGDAVIVSRVIVE